ncbi:hypothetical protein PR202_ga00073 [Eleusine coracana subsp. coracana]|uniref:Uncharacterized protein n=1 Tax=Eleusine coracana subsp. coracana TaxID=191504 RepID=A0AAV5BF77_ELECO|nr:hypothetical protein PR202_ga00073 [Eleusine coracana subsp. coracana]
MHPVPVVVEKEESSIRTLVVACPPFRLLASCYQDGSAPAARAAAGSPPVTLAFPVAPPPCAVSEEHARLPSVVSIVVPIAASLLLRRASPVDNG